jgi:hypothetical protein
VLAWVAAAVVVFRVIRDAGALSFRGHCGSFLEVELLAHVTTIDMERIFCL